MKVNKGPFIFLHLKLRTLQTHQSRAYRSRLITGSGTHISCIPMFQELRWLTLQHRCDFYKLVIVYKCRSGLAPNASLRVTKYVKARTAYYNSSFALYCQRLWNALTKYVKLCTSLSSFKNAPYTYMITKPQF